MKSKILIANQLPVTAKNSIATDGVSVTEGKEGKWNDEIFKGDDGMSKCFCM